MTLLKRILLVLLAIVALMLILALFVKKEYAVERQIAINKPRQVVFDYIKMLKNQDNYSKWNMTDPNKTSEFKGTDGTVGFVYAWDSKMKNVGKGEQEIKNIVDGERIDMELRFKKPFEATDNAYLMTESVDSNQTTVKWGFNGKMNYPMNLMLMFMNMDEMLGKDMAEGLNNLKGVMEK